MKVGPEELPKPIILPKFDRRAEEKPQFSKRFVYKGAIKKKLQQ